MNIYNLLSTITNGKKVSRNTRSNRRETTGYTRSRTAFEGTTDTSQEKVSNRASRKGLGRIRIRVRTKQDSILQGECSKTDIKERLIPFTLFFYYIIYSPYIWVLLFIIDTSFADELIAYNFYNLNVIINTTQCLLSKECIG